MTGFMDTFLHNLSLSQTIITTHNKWLPKTRSVLTGLRLSSLIVFLLLWLTCFRFTLRLPSDLQITLFLVLLSTATAPDLIWQAPYIALHCPRRYLLLLRIHGQASCFPTVYNFPSRIHGHVCLTPDDLCPRIISPRKSVWQFVS
jgi:hypothetical protein